MPATRKNPVFHSPPLHDYHDHEEPTDYNDNQPSILLNPCLAAPIVPVARAAQRSSRSQDSNDEDDIDNEDHTPLSDNNPVPQNLILNFKQEDVQDIPNKQDEEERDQAPADDPDLPEDIPKHHDEDHRDEALRDSQNFPVSEDNPQRNGFKLKEEEI